MPPSTATTITQDLSTIETRSKTVEAEEEDLGSSKAATFAIRGAILGAEKELIAKYPFLKHQNAIGFGIFLGSMVVMVLAGYAYATGLVPWWAALLTNAFFGSFLHELEHDLIHKLYFNRTMTWMRDVMMAFIFAFKMAPIDPWTRGKYHLLHHRKSGQIEDIEERLIGLGQPMINRVAVAIFPGTAALWLRDLKRECPEWKFEHTLLERFIQLIQYAFVFTPPGILYAAYHGHYAATVAAVTWILPNIWRHACLVLLSTSSHFYGDIGVNNVLQQTQILRHWALVPFQIFCCNFGAEHGIHHFQVGQPFYIRHMVRHPAWEAMIANGVRCNDFGAFMRQNRWGAFPSAAKSE